MAETSASPPTSPGRSGNGAIADSGAPEGVAPPPEAPPLSRGRKIAVRSLIGISTLLLVVGVFAIWANRLLFSPDNWANNSTQLHQNRDVRSGTANYLVDQLYANVNVAGLLRSGLPTRLQPLAAPAAGALQNVAVQGVELALARPRIQSLWAKANRAAAQGFIALVRGGSGPVGVKEGVVRLDLASILGSIATRLGLPSSLASKLPPQAANLTVLRSNQLGAIQDGGNAIQGLALWLTVLVPLLYVVALLLAPGHRRRTLMTIGFAGVLAGVLALLGRSLLESQVPSALTHDASLKTTIVAIMAVSTGLLGQVAGAVIAIGGALIVAAWFAGPARVARLAREAIAPALREHPDRTYATTLGLMFLIFIWDPIPATGKPAGIIVFIVLALVGTEVLRRQTAQEFPDARTGTAWAVIRARWHALRHPRPRPGSAPIQATVSIADQLSQLVDLRESGAITPDEYQTAKQRLLHA